MCRVFPKLYRIVGAKGTMITDCWTETSERGAWDPKFERSFNDWELEAVQQLLSVLSNLYIYPHLKDKVT